MRNDGEKRCRRLGLLLGLLACLAGNSLPAAVQDGPIEIGIIPTLSTRTILTTYQPLREYLEAHLKKPVVLVTAPDYRKFVEQTQHGDFRFVITASHFARLAQTDAGYLPLVRVQPELRGLLVVRADSRYQRVGDLRHTTISTPDDLAVISMLGIQQLREQGLEPGKAVTIRSFPSFNSAVLAVQNGESSAAYTAQTALNQMPEETRAALRTLATTRSVPHVIFLANKQVPANEAEQMQRLLLDFADDKPKGEAFFKTTGFVRFTRTVPQEMQALEPYVTELKRRLARP